MQKERLSYFVGMFLDLQIETTRKSYEYCLRDMMESVGDIPLEDVTGAMLAKYIHDYEARPAVTSPATVNKAIKTTKALFSWAVNMEYLYKNPARVLKTRKRSKYVRREKAMSDEELNILLTDCRNRIENDTCDSRGKLINVDHYRNLALILFLADGGGRRRGAVSLKMTDIDLDLKQAIVTEKGNKERVVWFGDETANALREWFTVRSKWLIQNDYTLQDVYVFNRYGKKMESDALGQVIRRLCLRAGVRSLGPHSLRHRKGHQLQKATDLVTASQVLGHSDPRITAESYFKKDLSHAEEVARKLAIKSPSDDRPKTPPQLSDKIIPFPKASNS